MLNNTIDVTAAPCGAAFPGARSPWTMLQAIGLSAVGMNHVRTPYPVPVAWLPTRVSPRSGRSRP